MSAIEPVQSMAPETPPPEAIRRAEAPALKPQPEPAAEQKDRVREPLRRASAGGAGAAAPVPVASVGAHVSLSVDLQLRETIIRVVDPETGKVIRQIPSEELLRQRRAYAESEKQVIPEGDSGVA